MPRQGILREEWASIHKAISSAVSKRGESFIQGVVVKRDVKKKLIWLKEFGEQPIPLVGYRIDLKYYDTQDTADGGGPVLVRKQVLTPQVPKIGDTVLVAQQLGSRRLPKCLGVILSTGYVVPGGD